MEVLFEADGKLADVLVRFKAEYLAGLHENDLQKSVLLRVSKKEGEDGTSEGEGWLKEKLLQVVEEF